MNPSRLRPLVPSKPFNRTFYRSISHSQRLEQRQRLDQSYHIVPPLLRQCQTKRHFHASPVVSVMKAPSTYDREAQIRSSGQITQEQADADMATHVAPFLEAAVMNGVFDLADLEFMKKLVLYTYVKTVSVEELLEVFNHEAGRMAKGCLILLRNKVCAVGARRILVGLAYHGEPFSVIFEANELLRLQGRVDERTKQRVRTVAGRGVFPEAATLYARIIESEDPKQAAAWYERAMETSRPELRHKTFEASLPLGHMKQHWEHYVGLMTDVMGDQDEAIRALKIGADKYDQSTACYSLAILAHRDKDYVKKEWYLLKAAQDGHRASCRSLGELYTRAFLVKWLNKNQIEDVKRYVIPPEDREFAKRFDENMLQLFAEEWLRIAAEQRDNEARVRLACLLHMLERHDEGLKLLKEADEVSSLIHVTTPVQKKVPELRRAWYEKQTGRDALLRWDFSP